MGSVAETRKGVLGEIVRSTRAELARRKRERPLDGLEAELAGHRGGAGRFVDALRRPGVAVIAELKRRAPSAGVLREGAEVSEVVGAYERGGASAVSVLTEGPHFGGSLEDLRRARESCALPLLRKDFTVDPYQLYEARLAGADAVLLIVAALGQPELCALREHARALGLDALVEVHDREEVRRALDAGAELVGINNRDLRDFTVDVGRTVGLMGELPGGVTVVSESGIAEAATVRRLGEAGVHAVLVGGALMRAADPEAALRALAARAGAPKA